MEATTPSPPENPTCVFFEVRTVVPYTTFESDVVLSAAEGEQECAGGYRNLVCDTQSQTVQFSNAKPVNTRLVVGTG